MSGKRQHYLPQFLQRGFAHERAAKGLFTWVHRKEGEPYETNLINSGAEGRFYDKGEDRTVDDLITDAEGRFSVLVEQARTLPFGDIPSDGWPEFIAHLEVRGRHLRQVLLKTSDFLTRHMIEQMSDTEEFGRFIERRIFCKPELVDQMVLENAHELGIPPSMIPEFVRQVRANLPAMIPHIKTQVLPTMIEQLRAEFPARVLEQVRGGHIDALKTSDGAPEIRVKRYQEFTFSLVKVDSADMVLGDCAVLFQTESARSWKPLVDNTDRLKAVILPLAPDRLLVGRIGNVQLELGSLNVLIARASMEFFISNACLPSYDGLAATLTSDAFPMTPDELKKIVQSVIDTPDRP